MPATEFIEANGVRTRVRSAGSGDPLVLIHGGEFGDLYSLDAWEPMLLELQSTFSVIAFDRLGQGHTGNPSSTAGYTYASLLDHAIAVIEQYGNPPATLVGHSRGGLVAVRAAQVRPDLVRSLVIVDSGTLADNDDPQTVKFYEGIDRQLADGVHTLDDARLESLAQSYSPAHVTDEWSQALLEIAQLESNAAARQAMAPIKLDSWYSDISAVVAEAQLLIDAHGLPVPVHLIWGQNDPSASSRLAPRLFQRIAARTERCTLTIINHAGHFVYREQPDRFAAVLRGQLSADDSGGPRRTPAAARSSPAGPERPVGARSRTRSPRP